MIRSFISNREDSTILLAKELTNHLHQGSVITLTGNLGAGKTTFTKGIAEGLDIRRPITSPTFTIIKEYEGRIPLYHMDTYRLENSEEDIGFEEYFYSDGVTVIEWAEFIEDYLPEDRLNITFVHVDENIRQITFQTASEQYISMIKNIIPPEGIIE